jgi:hypothetical protein
MDITDFTYDEMEATFRRKRKAAIPKLWSYSNKLHDPYRPKYYTMIELFVPQPSFFSPFPCILVSIRNTRFKTFFRILDLSDLESVFTIPPEEHQKASVALQNAKIEASTIEQRIKDILATKNLAGLPSGIRSMVKVDEKTGELLIE